MAELSTNNLYKYATGELSQDAFICWLMSHLLPENKNKDKLLVECAAKLFQAFEGEKITPGGLKNIYKQLDFIDVLLVSDKFYVIVEDKTFTAEHDKQIDRYRASIQKRMESDSENWPERKVVCVYYKIVEQSRIETSADVNITRADILRVMRPYRQKVTNQIFTDYVDYMEYIEDRTQAFNFLPVDKWDSFAYQGFFTDIQRGPNAYGLTAPMDGGWDYVSNPSGGFWAFWWQGPVTMQRLDAAGLTEDRIENLYLQIENNKVAVKLAVNREKHNKEVVQSLRWKIFDFYQRELSGKFKKGTFRYGTYMTVGWIYFDEHNYRFIFQEVERVMDKLLKEVKF